MQWTQLLGFTVVGALVTTTGTLIGLFLKEVLLARSFEGWKARQSLSLLSQKYREPIALAALDLCRRLIAICDKYPPNFLDSSLLSSAPEKLVLNREDDPYFRRYRLISTVYRLCSFLGWMELYRQDMTFLHAADGPRERRVDIAINAVLTDLAEGELNKAVDRQDWHDVLLFRDEQRAIGESMIVSAGGARAVIGYGEFCQSFPGDASTSRGRWLGIAGRFLFDLQPEKDFRQVRMQRLIVHLVELVDILSPTRLQRVQREAYARYKDKIASDAS